MAYAVLKIGGKDVPMMSNAATPIRYRQVFRKNLNSFFLGKMPEEDAADLPGELAYIMAQAASGADMNKLSYDGYVDWLQGFEALDFASAVTPIINVYQNNLASDSEVKKNQDQPTGK